MAVFSFFTMIIAVIIYRNNFSKQEYDESLVQYNRAILLIGFHLLKGQSLVHTQPGPFFSKSIYVIRNSNTQYSKQMSAPQLVPPWIANPHCNQLKSTSQWLNKIPPSGVRNYFKKRLYNETLSRDNRDTLLTVLRDQSPKQQVRSFNSANSNSSRPTSPFKFVLAFFNHSRFLHFIFQCRFFFVNSIAQKK